MKADKEQKVQKQEEDDRTIMVNGRPALLKNVRVVKINGRSHTLVIGREYEFRLKPGTVLTPCEPLKNSDAADEKAAKAAPKKATRKSPAKNVAAS